MSILEHRKAIDRLDQQLVRLLNERARHAREIGLLKQRHGREIYAPDREQRVLQRVGRLNRGPLSDESLRAIYREIMSSALAVEKPLTIAYLGPAATFTHQAALQRFGTSVRYSPHKTIADVFSEVARRRADYGVVPVENSTEGVVTHTLDMLMDSDLRIVGQIVMPISQCLLAKGPRNRIKRLYIHPQSLAQCREWLRRHLPDVEIIETASNARSAELAAREPGAAAVAGLLAAEQYGLPVLEHNIQDNADNATRFLVLGRQCPDPTGNDRTSLMFSVADRPGALHDAIAPFRKYRINMTKIESRPSKRKAWQYYFFVDCDGHARDPKVERALTELGRHCVLVKVLGSYPNTD